ncbi:NtaA/DmoA family FMN-dependent monooxygenase [Pseudomonas typographi]|uniref:NtaA/DmoA family FMN-dependent monooxygenase n=1 Tax=Pseudomonas typographi TaxID=2715964 RepID=A0ABR7YZZ4_9PSED|nr:NtaA/DmoA family FMN-dependent monooxygenase [Pseudomonas typographi]MBD1550547.1 NtaA/DmoA family FMN-dependent monooxygenase [Pseudomonas typographi]MBD1586866.1 NtaA/DmoA family FMN-dependent monooxygenase [Pseudomonas typographi]MBD1598762.1 NtaA/DmoA family FMN-dependent monooxygenase [Pseudomonas typographi]
MIKFGAVLGGVGVNPADWLQEDVPADASVNVDWLVGCAEDAEAAGLDFVFMSDALFITPDSSPFMLARFEPMTLLSALAMRTRHIGLVGTVSTSYSEPFNVARAFASLDLLSHGRAGWNLVTTAIEKAGANFSRRQASSHEQRYDRAEEYIEVVRGLWDSYEDDAFPRDKAQRRFLDKDKQHALNYEGKYFQVAGPLSSVRSPQGHPVIFQAGDSDRGRQFSARHADAVFSLPHSEAKAQEYYRDLKNRAAALGRQPEEIKVIVGINPFVHEDGATARRAYGEFLQHTSLDDGVKRLGFLFNQDFSRHPLDEPFHVDAQQALNGYQGMVQEILGASQAERLSLRDTALRFGIRENPFVGSYEEVAAQLERWYRNSAADGFNIEISSRVRFRQFANGVLPILVQKGLFRREYEGTTLRDRLGLAFVKNRHAPA